MKVLDEPTVLARLAETTQQFLTAFMCGNPSTRGTLVWVQGGRAMMEVYSCVGVESNYLELSLEDVVVERIWDGVEDVEDLLFLWFKNHVSTLKTTYDSLAEDPLVFSIDVNESIKEMDVICV